jgi:hypothetical protein
MSLHERLRDNEAAPWVIKEIKKIEEERDRLKAAMTLIANGHTYCSYTHNKSDLKCRTFAQKALDHPKSAATTLEQENALLKEALMAIATAEGREHYAQELWAALLMDKARAALAKCK